MAVSTHVLSASPRHGVGKTFLVAMSLLGITALAQLGAVGKALLERSRIKMALLPVEQKVEEPATQSDFSAMALPPVITEPAELPHKEPMEVSSLQGQAPGASLSSSSRTRSSPDSRIAALVAQARTAREVGDMGAALVKLREAQALLPENAMVLAELALTYDAMGLGEKAAEFWRRVQSQGEKAGALFQLAEMKLKEIESTAVAAVPMGTSSLLGRDTEGLQPGSSFGLIDVRQTDLEDPAALRKLQLRVGLRARAGLAVDARDVVIQVLFYDLVDGQHIVQTNAQVNTQWVTPPPDWSDDGIEVLEVGYLQTRVAESATEEQGVEGNRKFLGYVVRIYYKGALQDVRADPVRLLTLYPPPLELEKN